jgi:hypothetical protein
MTTAKARSGTVIRGFRRRFISGFDEGHFQRFDDRFFRGTSGGLDAGLNREFDNGFFGGSDEGFDGEHSLEFHAHGYHSLLQNIHVFS